MKWHYLILAYFTLFTVGFLDNTRGPIYTSILTHFAINQYAVGSWFFTTASIAGLLSSIAARFWLPRLGPIAALRYFLVLQSLGILGMGWAGSSKSSSFDLFLVPTALYGFGAGALSILVNILAGHAVHSDHQRKALSGLHATYGVASLIAPLAWALTLESKLSWGNHYLILGCGTLIMALISFRMTTPTKGEEPPATMNPAHEIPPLAWGRRLPYGVLLASYVAAEIMLSSRIPLYIEKVWAGNSAEASFFLSLFFALLLMGRLVFTLFHFKGTTHRWLAASLIASICSLLIGVWVHPIGLAVCGLTMSLFFPCTMEFLHKQFQSGAQFMIASAMTATALALMVMHQLVGSFADWVGLKQAFLIGPFCLLISLCALWFILKNPPPKLQKVVNPDSA